MGSGRHLKLRLAAPESGELLEAIAFNVDEALLQAPPDRILTVYRLDVNEFRGRRSLQLICEHLQPL